MDEMRENDPYINSIVTPSPDFVFEDSLFHETSLEYTLDDFDNLMAANQVQMMDNFAGLEATPSGLAALLEKSVLEETLAENPVDQPANFLLIKIPDDLQNSPIFDSLPSINLKPNIIREINKASEGNDGVYLPLNVKYPEPSTRKIVNVIRRRPLQVIQTVVPVVKVQTEEPPRPSKRKQQFNLTREDGIVFLSDTPDGSPTIPQTENKDGWFATLIPSQQSLEDEANRCSGCHKVFKNLNNHNCRKLFPSAQQSRPEKESMICASCGKKYKSKAGLIKHFSKCDQSSVFSGDSETDDAIEGSLDGSGVKILSIEVLKEEEEVGNDGSGRNGEEMKNKEDLEVDQEVCGMDLGGKMVDQKETKIDHIKTDIDLMDYKMDLGNKNMDHMETKLDLMDEIIDHGNNITDEEKNKMDYMKIDMNSEMDLEGKFMDLVKSEMGHEKLKVDPNISETDPIKIEVKSQEIDFLPEIMGSGEGLLGVMSGSGNEENFENKFLKFIKRSNEIEEETVKNAKFRVNVTEDPLKVSLEFVTKQELNIEKDFLMYGNSEAGGNVQDQRSHQVDLPGNLQNSSQNPKNFTEADNKSIAKSNEQGSSQIKLTAIKRPAKKSKETAKKRKHVEIQEQIPATQDEIQDKTKVIQSKILGIQSQIPEIEPKTPEILSDVPKYKKIYSQIPHRESSTSILDQTPTKNFQKFSPSSAKSDRTPYKRYTVPKIEKPATRYSTKPAKMLTRSASKTII